jgi:hypothetical protein
MYVKIHFTQMDVGALLVDSVLHALHVLQASCVQAAREMKLGVAVTVQLAHMQKGRAFALFARTVMMSVGLANTQVAVACPPQASAQHVLHALQVNFV